MDYCLQCKLEKKICDCSNSCPDCNTIILDYPSSCTSNNQYCACNLEYIESLKTKLIDNHDLEIREEDQTDVTQMSGDQLEKYSIEPITPGQLDGFCSNINCVPKPVSDTVSLGKADTHTNKQRGIVKNNQRVTLDLRKVNSCMLPDAKITLPLYKTLTRQFSDCYCSNFDMYSMFWAISLNYSSQSKTNFWYDGRIYKMTCLAMGIKNACYVAQKASILTYSDNNLREKSIEKQCALFPFSSTKNFC